MLIGLLDGLLGRERKSWGLGFGFRVCDPNGSANHVTDGEPFFFCFPREHHEHLVVNSGLNRVTLVFYGWLSSIHYSHHWYTLCTNENNIKRKELFALCFTCAAPHLVHTAAMKTKKHEIKIRVDDDLYGSLASELERRGGESVTTISALIREAISRVYLQGNESVAKTKTPKTGSRASAEGIAPLISRAGSILTPTWSGKSSQPTEPPKRHSLSHEKKV